MLRALVLRIMIGHAKLAHELRNSIYSHIISVFMFIFFYRLQVPPTMRFYLDGEMPSYLLAKDIILQVP